MIQNFGQLITSGNIVIGLVYFCVIACSFFITYKIVFRKLTFGVKKKNKMKEEEEA